MKIISFDVGIKNMAYCIFSIKDSLNHTPFEMNDWNVVSLLEKEEPHVYCNCASVKPKVLKKVKINVKPIQNFFVDASLNLPDISELPSTKLCCRVGKYKKGKKIFCDKHAKAQTEWLIPESRFSQKVLKKTKVDDLIILASDLKMENIGKKRADIMKGFEDFVQKKCLEPVSIQKSKSAGDADLVSIGKKMREQFDEILKHHKDITHVLIENQISPLSPFVVGADLDRPRRRLASRESREGTEGDLRLLGGLRGRELHGGGLHHKDNVALKRSM
jgi:hypothetical protein